MSSTKQVRLHGRGVVRQAGTSRASRPCALQAHFQNIVSWRTCFCVRGGGRPAPLLPLEKRLAGGPSPPPLTRRVHPLPPLHMLATQYNSIFDKLTDTSQYTGEGALLQLDRMLGACWVHAVHVSNCQAYMAGSAGEDTWKRRRCGLRGLEESVCHSI